MTPFPPRWPVFILIVSKAKCSVWMYVIGGLELNWVQYQINQRIEMDSDTNSAVWLCTIFLDGIIGATIPNLCLVADKLNSGIFYCAAQSFATHHPLFLRVLLMSIQ
jgi:hypothetical protein